MSGKIVRLAQLNQAKAKLVPDEVLIKGKLVRLEQSTQAKAKLVPDEVLIRGKLVISNRFRQ